MLCLKFINYINLGLQTYLFMKPLFKFFSVNFVHVTNAFIFQLLFMFTGTFVNNFVILNTLG